MDTTVADPLIGALLDGRYRIHSRIARGGMATVYRAVDERLERVVAVKVIKPSHAGNAEFLSKFDQEAKTIARLTHPNVVSVYDTGEHEGLPYLVMELIQGRTLRELLSQRKRLSPADAIAVADPLLSAVAAAHRAGLVHRDVKPENVLIGDDGTVKVADFGLARAVEASSEDGDGQLMATAAYVAPELVTQGRSDPRADVYSAGTVLFEMLTGKVPYEGEQTTDVAHQHVEQDVPAPSSLVRDLPKALDDVVVRATRRDPSARPADADAFLTELRAASAAIGLDPELAQTRPIARVVARAAVAPAWERDYEEPYDDYHEYAAYPREPRRRTGLAIAAAVVVFGLLVAIAGWWLGAGRYTEAPSLLKMTKQEAEAVAKRQGFAVEFKTEFSEQTPKNVVLDQEPGPRERIVQGGTITVIVSLGPERYEVPDLIGVNVDEATAELRERKLEPDVKERYSDTVPRDSVISTSPKAGKRLSPGSTVTLTVSKGTAPITVPDLVGEHVTVAQQELEDAGLTVVVKTERSTEVERDHVISQDPEPGTGVGERAEVTLLVSSGPPQVEVPDVIGETQSDAETILQDAGFDVQVFKVPYADDVVREQSPNGGETADKGSTVTIWIY